MDANSLLDLAHAWIRAHGKPSRAVRRLQIRSYLRGLLDAAGADAEAALAMQLAVAGSDGPTLEDVLYERLEREWWVAQVEAMSGARSSAEAWLDAPHPRLRGDAPWPHALREEFGDLDVTRLIAQLGERRQGDD